MGLPRNIAIDGPAGSGKSTLGEKLAEYLGYLYFDTGVMYRAVTLAVLERGMDVWDEDKVTSLAEELDIDVQPPSVEDGRAYDVLMDGRDVTWEIRQPVVDRNVSIVSAYSKVRETMVAAQRVVGMRGRVVMVGRDIGSIVLPEAELKLYLDASLEERAHRRFQELQSRSSSSSYDEVLRSLQARDRIDSTREVSPLVIPADALVVDSDNLDADQVLQKVLERIEGVQGARGKEN
jgi:CMP/dCMP kinase